MERNINILKHFKSTNEDIPATIDLKLKQYQSTTIFWPDNADVKLDVSQITYCL